MEGSTEKSYELAKYTHENFPDNPFFERYHARSAYMAGKLDEAIPICKSILSKIEQRQPGYEAVSGRYASYILGYYQLYIFKNLEEGKKYFNQCIEFSEQSGTKDSGYYWAALLGLARASFQESEFDKAVDLCKEVMEKAEKKSSQYTEAKKLLSEAKKARRKKK
jgi:tetratricopeptide (TPR) repeat protein